MTLERKGNTIIMEFTPSEAQSLAKLIIDGMLGHIERSTRSTHFSIGAPVKLSKNWEAGLVQFHIVQEDP